MGDTVLMTAPVLELIRAFPQAEIHVAVTSAWAPIFDRMPGVAKVWKYERHRERAARAKAATRMALRLRRERYDTVVCFHASPSTRDDELRHGREDALDPFSRPSRPQSLLDSRRFRARACSSPSSSATWTPCARSAWRCRPAGCLRFFFRPQEAGWAANWLESIAATGPVLGVGLGASRPTKSWPMERYAELAVRWCSETRGSAVAIAGPEESRIALNFLKAVDDLLVSDISDAAARAALRRRIGAHADLSLRQLCAFLARRGFRRQRLRPAPSGGWRRNADGHALRSGASFRMASLSDGSPPAPFHRQPGLPPGR